MRKFRAIVQSSKEPMDHEIIWSIKGNLFYWENGKWNSLHKLSSEEISFGTEEDTSLSTVEEALKKLLYVVPEVNLTVNDTKIHEIGDTVYNLKFTWDYNKDIITYQKLNGISLDTSVRSFTFGNPITSTTKFCLEVSDGTNIAKDYVTIEFKDFVYINLGNITKRIEDTVFDVTVLNDMNLRIFIPNSLPYNKIYVDGIDSTDGFNIYKDFIMINSKGTLYTSKNTGLGDLTIELKD